MASRTSTILSAATSAAGASLGSDSMASDSAARPALPTVSIRELAPFLVFGLVLGLLALYFVGAEQGATSVIGGHMVHEFVHDGRHLLGFPCH